jgi:hypothetical protein
MDTQILKVKHMKLDKLKSRAEELTNEINSLTILESSISEFDKKLDDSRHILNELEDKNQTKAAELMAKEIYHKEQTSKYTEFENDSAVMEKKIKDIEDKIASQKLQNVSYEERINKEKEHLTQLEEEYAKLEEERQKYNTMWTKIIENVNEIAKNINSYIEIKQVNNTDHEEEKDSIIEQNVTPVIKKIKYRQNIDRNLFDTKYYEKNSRVTNLDCSNSMVENIKYIPNTLKILRCEDTKIKTLPELHEGLEELYCFNTSITTLPKLPTTLRVLNCGSCKLTKLPELPNSLTHLYCVDCSLSNLPELPSNLEVLACNNNKLINLPELPNSLINLACYDNELINLPPLPKKNFIRLECFLNKFMVLSKLPDTLKYLSTDPSVRLAYRPQNLYEWKTWHHGILTDKDFS